MRIELATMDDLDWVVEAWVELARDQRRHGSHVRGKANRSTMRRALAEHVVDGTLLVARDEGIVGFVNFDTERSGFERTVARGVIRNVYVEPAARNASIGTALIEAAEAALKAAGAEAIALEVMAANSAARRLYRRREYRPHRIEFERQVENDPRSNDDGRQ